MATEIVEKNKPHLGTDPEKLPCIYGRVILYPCPARMTLAQPDISRYTIPTDKGAAAVKSLIDGISSVLPFAADMSVLVSFCRECPHKEIFYWTQMKKRELTEE